MPKIPISKNALKIVEIIENSFNLGEELFLQLTMKAAMLTESDVLNIVDYYRSAPEVIEAVLRSAILSQESAILLIKLLGSKEKLYNLAEISYDDPRFSEKLVHISKKGIVSMVSH